MTNQPEPADRPFADEPTDVLRAALGLATRHAEQAARFRPAQPDDALPAVVGLLRAELQHREGTLLPPPEGPEYTPCSSCTHIEPEHQPDAGPCLVCDCRAYEPAAVSAAVAPPTNQTVASREAEAELYVLLRKAGEPRDEAQALIDRHRDEVLRRAELRSMADETATETPAAPAPTHLGNRANAEDCPACKAEARNLPYPFLCPDEPAAGARQDGAHQ